MLTIVVDARLLSEKITGIGRYLNELLSRLVLEKDINWILISHAPIEIGSWDFPNVKIISGNIKTRAMRMIWAQFLLPVKLLKIKPDIFWSPSHRLPIFMISNIKQIMTIHDLVCYRAPSTMRTGSMILDFILIPISIFKADKIFTVSEFTKSEIRKILKVRPSKIVVTHLGATNFSKSDDVFLNESGYILYVGTCEPRKNLNNLIYAYSMLSPEIKKLHKLVIVGGKGWGKVNPILISEFYDVVDNVIYLGYVSEILLSYLYSNCLFLAFPSKYEGFGLPILEAMQFGKAVLTSNKASMPEIAGKAGYYVDPTSPESIKIGLETLTRNNELRNKLGEEAHMQSQLYSWDKCMKITIGEFRRLEK